MAAERLDPNKEALYQRDAHRAEVVSVCYNYGDLCKLFLSTNMTHFDNVIIVTGHDDEETQHLCHKYGARCVKTDLFHKDGHPFNKGAAINAGMRYFKFQGLRFHIDIDILLPLTFRRILMNHYHMRRDGIYGAIRFDVIGAEGVAALRAGEYDHPAHAWGSGVSPVYGGTVYAKRPSASSTLYVGDLDGYCPIGFFQGWHASQQRDYPYSGGDAGGDDLAFAASFPLADRYLLPLYVAHVNGRPPSFAENWRGRSQPRIDGRPFNWLEIEKAKGPVNWRVLDQEYVPPK